jgi:hypothetical protein
MNSAITRTATFKYQRVLFIILASSAKPPLGVRGHVSTNPALVKQAPHFGAIPVPCRNSLSFYADSAATLSIADITPGATQSTLADRAETRGRAAPLAVTGTTFSFTTAATLLDEESVVLS